MEKGALNGTSLGGRGGDPTLNGEKITIFYVKLYFRQKHKIENNSIGDTYGYQIHHYNNFCILYQGVLYASPNHVSIAH